MDFFQVANQKTRKAINNVHFILNKIHLSLYATKIMASFPLIYSWHLTILGSCYCKSHIDVSFLCVCPLIDNEFHHNIVRVYCRTTLTMLWRNLSSIWVQTHKNLLNRQHVTVVLLDDYTICAKFLECICQIRWKFWEGKSLILGILW